MLEIIAIGVFLATVAILVVAIIYPSMTSRKVMAFETVVVDKYESRSMIYTGIFVPIVNQYLVVEMGVEVKVGSSDYRRVEIGDTVCVSRYSDGSYRLERYASELGYFMMSMGFLHSFTTARLVLPSSQPSTPPMPRLPMTIMSTPSS